MNKLEKALEDKKIEIGDIHAPDNFEEIIREKLEFNKKKNKRFNITKIASVFIMIIILGYNSSTLAFYGRNLLGYENVMNDTLLELSNLGQGQVIDKEVVFFDGLRVRLDMIMLDGNGLILFYSIKDESGKIDIEDINLSTNIKGLFYNTGHAGYGEYIESENEQRWVLITSQRPKIFNQRISFGINYNNSYEEIEFKLDRRLAVGETIRFNVDKRIEILGREIEVEEISASSVSTIVSGNLQGIVSLGRDIFNKDRVFYDRIDMSLMADGVEVEKLGSGLSTNLKGTNFSIRFDALPEGTNNISLVLNSLNVRRKLSDEIEIELGSENNISVFNEELLIKGSFVENGKTYIEIESREGIRVPSINLLSDDEVYYLEDTINIDYFKTLEGEIRYARTLVFNGSGDNLRLKMGDIIYEELIDEEVYKFKN